MPRAFLDWFFRHIDHGRQVFIVRYMFDAPAWVTLEAFSPYPPAVIFFNFHDEVFTAILRVLLLRTDLNPQLEPEDSPRLPTDVLVSLWTLQFLAYPFVFLFLEMGTFFLG